MLRRPRCLHHHPGRSRVHRGRAQEGLRPPFRGRPRARTSQEAEAPQGTAASAASEEQRDEPHQGAAAAPERPPDDAGRRKRRLRQPLQWRQAPVRGSAQDQLHGQDQAAQN